MTTLLLHGFTGSPASFDAIVAGLPRSERTLRPMISGHGIAPALATGFAGELSRIAAFLRAEDAAPEGGIHVVGYSLGARLALGLALEHPTLVCRLTLIGPSAGIEAPEARHARTVADDALASMLRCQGLRPFLDHWEALPLFATQRRLPEPVRAARRAERESHDPDALAQALAGLSKGRMPSYASRLGELHVPVTLVAGELDLKFVEEARAMATRIRNAKVVVVPGAGHDVVLEEPSALLGLLNGESA